MKIEVIKERDITTHFGRMLAYIDTQPLGSSVSRKNLLTVVYGRSTNISRSTVDKWRRQLTVLGYLKPTKTPGVFIKAKEVPGTMTTSWLEDCYTRELSTFYRNKKHVEENEPYEY